MRYTATTTAIPPAKKIADTSLFTAYTSQERVRQTEVQSSLASECVVNNFTNMGSPPLCVPGLGLGRCPRGVSFVVCGITPCFSRREMVEEKPTACALVIGVFPKQTEVGNGGEAYSLCPASHKPFENRVAHAVYFRIFWNMSVFVDFLDR